MKMTNFVNRKIEEITDILCNKCGGSLVPEPCKKHKFKEFYGLVEANVVGGFFSEHLSDEEVYEFSLCEFCLKKLFDSFVYPAFKDKERCEASIMDNFLKDYSQEDLKVFFDDLKNKHIKTAEDLRLLDRIEESLISYREKK